MYLRLEPEGGQRLDYWGARLLSYLSGVFERRPRPPLDFLPAWWERPAPARKTPEQMAAILDAFAAAHNASLNP